MVQACGRVAAGGATGDERHSMSDAVSDRFEASLQWDLGRIERIDDWARLLDLSRAGLGRQTERRFGLPPGRALEVLKAGMLARLLEGASRAQDPEAGAAAARFLDLRGRVQDLSPNLSIGGVDRSRSVCGFLPVHAPFDPQECMDFLATRAVEGVERIEDVAGGRAYVRRFRSRRGLGEIGMAPVAEGVRIRIRAPGAIPLQSLLPRARRVFDTEVPIGEVTRALSGDRRLRHAVRKRPGLRVPGAWDPFETAVRAILGQQVSVAAARTHAERLVALCGGPRLRGFFPSAARIARTDLSALAMPRARSRAIETLAHACVDGRLDFAWEESRVRSALLALPGVGPWTADYICMRALKNPDTFLPGDLVVRQQMAVDGRMPSIREAELQSERWRPWRAYAVLHLWASSGSGG